MQPPPPSRSPSASRSRLLYALIAGVGLVMALSGALAPAARGTQSLAPDVVARVNTHDISRAELDAALDQLYPSAQDAVTDEQRAEVLRFLVDEELLVQRAVQLNLARTDRAVRSAVVMGTIDEVVEEVLAREPTEQMLRDYYASHQAIFTESARWHVRHMRFDRTEASGAALLQAADARAAVAAGDPFDDIRARYGATGEDLPDGPVPEHMLRRYLGPALTELVLNIPAGTLADVIETSNGFHVIQVVAVQPERIRPYEEVADVVRREYLRRARDTALDDLLTRLKREGRITLAADAPSVTGE